MAGFWTLVVMWPVLTLLGWLGLLNEWPLHSNNGLALLAVVLSMAWVYVVAATIETAMRTRAKRP